MTELTSTLCVAGGGAMGACLRFQISVWFTARLTAWSGKDFPYGTLFVNVLGSFFIGVLAAVIKAGLIPAIPWHDFINAGFHGALTTFSTFSMDTFKACTNGEFGKAGLNLLANIGLCLTGTALGFSLITP